MQSPGRREHGDTALLRQLRRFILSLALALVPAVAFPADHTWNGVTAVWSTAANWTPNTATPGSGDAATITIRHGPDRRSDGLGQGSRRSDRGKPPRVHRGSLPHTSRPWPPRARRTMVATTRSAPRGSRSAPCRINWEMQAHRLRVYGSTSSNQSLSSSIGKMARLWAPASPRESGTGFVGTPFPPTESSLRPSFSFTVPRTGKLNPGS
jgi:hypothetical protein